MRKNAQTRSFKAWCALGQINFSKTCPHANFSLWDLTYLCRFFNTQCMTEMIIELDSIHPGLLFTFHFVWLPSVYWKTKQMLYWTGEALSSDPMRHSPSTISLGEMQKAAAGTDRKHNSVEGFAGVGGHVRVHTFAFSLQTELQPPGPLNCVCVICNAEGQLSRFTKTGLLGLELENLLTCHHQGKLLQSGQQMLTEGFKWMGGSSGLLILNSIGLRTRGPSFWFYCLGFMKTINY